LRCNFAEKKVLKFLIILIMKAIYRVLIIGLILITVAMTLNAQDKMPQPKGASIQKAICILFPTQGNNARGYIIFTRTEEGIKVVADLQGLSKGKHGFHIHEFGDCSSRTGLQPEGILIRKANSMEPLWI
jgi:Cu/Zn superoxide dismutase